MGDGFAFHPHANDMLPSRRVTDRQGMTERRLLPRRWVGSIPSEEMQLVQHAHFLVELLCTGVQGNVQAIKAV